MARRLWEIVLVGLLAGLAGIGFGSISNLFNPPSTIDEVWCGPYLVFAHRDAVVFGAVDETPPRQVPATKVAVHCKGNEMVLEENYVTMEESRDRYIEKFPFK